MGRFGFWYLCMKNALCLMYYATFYDAEWAFFTMIRECHEAWEDYVEKWGVKEDD